MRKTGREAFQMGNRSPVERNSDPVYGRQGSHAGMVREGEGVAIEFLRRRAEGVGNGEGGESENLLCERSDKEKTATATMEGAQRCEAIHENGKANLFTESGESSPPLIENESQKVKVKES